MMDAALVSDEGNCDQHKHYDQDDALFIFRKFEDPEQAFHPAVARLCICLARHIAFIRSAFLQAVILSEAKKLRSFFYTLTERIARDVSPSLNMTTRAYLA
jgi:hypothetical protein